MGDLGAKLRGEDEEGAAAPDEAAVEEAPADEEAAPEVKDATDAE
jgi:hypothetical protein